MPGQLLVPSRRKRIDGNEHKSDDDDDDVSSSSERSTSSKRARLEKSQPLNVNSKDRLPVSHVESLSKLRDSQNGTYEYTPGSVVRVWLANFVTYTSAEFNLGPSLNMIIGPNGTGKSTLVCAICLGLGWGPANLGRAKDLGEYVKHGMREATIEIELAGGRCEDWVNPVIRRIIKREGNKSSFYINDQASTQKAVQSLARSFSIQIDNLCQFLPQDRVVEFAALSPVDLLSSTQKAAAPDYLVKWHEKLKTLHSEWKRKKVDQSSLNENLANLEARQNLQRADVERLQQRKELVSKLAALEKMRIAVRYGIAANRVKAAKDRKKEAARELKDLENKMEPSLAAVKQKQSYLSQVDRVVSQKRNLLDKAEQSANKIDAEQSSLQQRIQQYEHDIEIERNNIKGQAGDLARIDQDINRIKRQLNEEPIEFDAAAFNEQIRDKTKQVRLIDTRTNDLSQSIHDARAKKSSSLLQIQKTKDDLEKLKSQAGQQLEKLKKVSQDTSRAVQWLQQNQSLFREPVYNPPIIECSVADRRFASAIESSLQRNDMLAFTCTNAQDFNTLQKYLYGKEHLGLGDINIRVARFPVDNYKPPVSEDQLHELGLSGWLRDYLSGPDPVISVLCDVSRIHCTAVTLDNQAASFDRIKDSPIQSWVAGKEYFQVVRRREYGPLAVSTRVRRVEPARIWTDEAGDSSAEREFRRTLNEIQDDINELDNQVMRGKEEHGRLKAEAKSISEEKIELEQEKATKQRIYGEYQALPTKLAALQEKKSGLAEARLQVRERIFARESEIDKTALERAQLTLKYANAADLVRKMHVELLETEIWQVETKSDLDTVTHRNKEVKDMLDARREELRTLESQWSELMLSAKRLLKELEEMLESRTSEEQDFQDQIGQDISPEDLEAEIESVLARLELLHDGNSDIIREFEQRRKHIEALHDKLSSLQTNVSTLKSNIDEIRGRWEPELDDLVKQISDAFSYNFSKIGCAGQIGIYKDDDFDQWAIQIQVKFRENEQLSLLDSHRQSGGERAVSTIFYLMALQSLARSPFRVVDEINQGMDPRNERIVHERMVDIACKEHTSQYFLITPKLLNGLRYDNRMKVHTIVSGEYVPKNYDDLNFQRMLRLAMRVKGQA